jgi:hypothetical protein
MRFRRWFYTAPLRLRSLLRCHQVEQELEEELRYHLDRQTEELIAKGGASALLFGLSPHDATTLSR